ncbi:MAG: heme-binding protein [Pseudomonadota bacterium]
MASGVRSIQFLFRNVLAVALVGCLTALALGTRAMAAEETPDYQVLETAADNIEIRAYPPLLLAEVVVTGNRNEAANQAFRILAAFIFGENTPQEEIAMTAPVTQARAEKIAMTAPVTQEPAESGGWTVAFMMPSKYTLATLPKPTDPRIVIRETEPRKKIAIRFSGRMTDENMNKHRDRLRAYMDEQGLTPAGPATFAYYNGPFTPFFLRRNEVIYDLADDSAV